MSEPRAVFLKLGQPMTVVGIVDIPLPKPIKLRAGVRYMALVRDGKVAVVRATKANIAKFDRGELP
jgi:hypothetical protein